MVFNNYCSGLQENTVLFSIYPHIFNNNNIYQLYRKKLREDNNLHCIFYKLKKIIKYYESNEKLNRQNVQKSKTYKKRTS